MGFLDFLQSVASGQTQSNPVLQRVAQQVTDAQHPTFAGHDVSGIPVLSGVLRPAVEAANYTGLLNEGAGQIAKGLTGAGTAALGGLNAALQSGAGPLVNALAQTTPLAPVVNALTLTRAIGPHLGPANPLPGLNAAFQGAQGPGNPLERAMAADRASAQTNPTQTSLGEMALNPLNFAGPAAEAGAGLRTAENAPFAMRALGTALEGAGATGKIAMLPYEAGFGAVGGIFKGVKNAVAPAAKEAVPALATAADAASALPAALAPPATSAPAFTRATLSAIAKSGMDPAKLAGLDDDLARYVAENAAPGQEDGLIAALRGATAPEVAPAAGVAPTPQLDQLRQAATFSDDPAVAKAAREQLAALETAPTTATPEVAPSTPVTPPVAEPAALDFTDRAGTIKAVANAPVSHLNAVLAALHNAVYPGQQADFAIPALTGQAKQEFRTSFLTDHPSGNAAEPYLDYLLSRVQKDPKAAARLADLNPQLADDITLLAESDLPLAEHKRLVQSLFGAGPFTGADTPAAALPLASGQPGAQAGTLDDLRALITSGDRGKMGGYAPSNADFYAKRLGIPTGDVPGMLDQLVQEGTLGRLPDGSLGIKPAPKPGFLGGVADAAGGGGFGLIAPRLGPTLAGATGGGLLGAGIGAATDPQDRARGAIGGGLLGAAVGGNLGALGPSVLPGLRTDLLDPLAAVAKEGAAATQQAIATGEKNPIPSFSRALPYIRSIKKTSAMTLPRNLVGALTTTAIGEGNVPEAAANMRDIWRNLPTLLPALRAAGNDAAARDQALLSALPPRMQAFDAAGMRDLIEQAGVNYERNPTDLGAANVHPLAGAMRGAGLAIATPKTLVMGPASLGLGAIEGATLPARAAMQTAMLTPIDQGARMAFAFPEYARQLADAAPGFLQKVQASGQNVAALATDGSFGATAVADPTLAAEWRGIQQQAASAGGALAKDRLGNFSDPGVSTGIVNALFPGGSWNVEQTKVLAKAAARHPQLAIGLLGIIEQDYQQHLAGGDPQHAGTWRLSDQTPGFGALVRLANGGAAGDLYINPAYPISPVGGEVLNLPRELSPQLNPGMSIYDKGKTVAGTLGLGVNPEIDLAAYKAGQSASAPSSQVRLAPVGAFADALLHEHGAPLWANPLGQALMPDAEQTPDLQQQIQFGRFLDPGAIRAGNEMIYEQRHTSSSDPANVDLVAQLRDPTSAFYHEALMRGLGGKAAAAALGDAVPGSPQAETATAHAGAAAKLGLLQQGLPITREQLQAIAARPDGGQILSQIRQAQIDAAKLANPVLAVQDLGTAKDLGGKVFDQWKRDNAGLALFPLVYGLQGQREQERLGLVPLGTAMQAQQQYDQLASGQSYGQPQPYPGVNPYPFDPTPLYDLMHYLNGGR